MALGKFGFIVTGAQLDAVQHRLVMRSPAFEMIAVGVSSPSLGVKRQQVLSRNREA